MKEIINNVDISYDFMENENELPLEYLKHYQEVHQINKSLPVFVTIFILICVSDSLADNYFLSGFDEENRKETFKILYER